MTDKTQQRDWSEVVQKLVEAADDSLVCGNIAAYIIGFREKALAILQEFDAQNLTTADDKIDKVAQTDAPKQYRYKPLFEMALYDDAHNCHVLKDSKGRLMAVEDEEFIRDYEPVPTIKDSLTVEQADGGWLDIEDAPRDGTEVLLLVKFPWNDSPRRRIGWFNDGINKVGFTWPCWMCSVSTVDIQEEFIIGWSKLSELPEPPAREGDGA